MLEYLKTEGVSESFSLPEIIESSSMTSRYHGTKIFGSQQ